MKFPRTCLCSESNSNIDYRGSARTLTREVVVTSIMTQSSGHLFVALQSGIQNCLCELKFWSCDSNLVLTNSNGFFLHIHRSASPAPNYAELELGKRPALIPAAIGRPSPSREMIRMTVGGPPLKYHYGRYI